MLLSAAAAAAVQLPHQLYGSVLPGWRQHQHQCLPPQQESLLLLLLDTPLSLLLLLLLDKHLSLLLLLTAHLAATHSTGLAHLSVWPAQRACQRD
jgi:hypothetical protein